MKNTVKISKKEFFLIIFSIILIAFLLYFFITTFLAYKYPLKYKKEIIEYSNKYNIQPQLVAAVINVESRYNKDAISQKGAIGLMQLMPSTAKWIAEKIDFENYNDELLFQPNVNIEFGCYYLSYLKGKFGGTTEILASYNAGEGTVRKWLNDDRYSVDSTMLSTIPYFETNKYIERVNKNLKYYTKKY